MEKIKPLIIKDNEKDMEYTLEFNREAIRFAESRGFIIDDLDKFQVTKIPEFFYYAFRMHHRNVPRNKTDEILEKLGGLTPPMLERLGELYAVPYTTVINIEEETKDPNFEVVL